MKLLKHLEKILGDRVAADPVNRALYCRDMMTGTTLELKAGHPPLLPDLVCWPETTEEISEILKFASHHLVPVIPFGGGSGVSGGTLPLTGGIILDLKKMNRVEGIKGPARRDNGAFFTVTAQCGILGQHLEDRLNEQGFTLGHFPSSILCATLGGYLAARSAGQLSSRYGKIEDMVEDLEAVLADGTMVRFGGRIKKLPHIRPVDLLVGAEGTLGVISRARLKIHPSPPAVRYRGVTFAKLPAALTATREIMQAGLRPSVVRLYDPLDSLLLQYGYEDKKKASKFPFKTIKDNFLKTLLLYPDLPQRLLGLLPTDCLLIFGFVGEADLIEAQEKAALDICRRRIARDAGAEPGLHWLKHRYSISFKMPELFEQGYFVDTIEVAATWDRLLPLYTGLRRILQKFALVLAHFSHAYPEGCSIYFTVIGHTGSKEKDCRIWRQLWRGAMERCLKLGGTISHHHGIGVLKAEWLPRELGGAMPFFKEIKKKLDPAGIMNPGKMGL